MMDRNLICAIRRFWKKKSDSGTKIMIIVQSHFSISFSDKRNLYLITVAKIWFQYHYLIPKNIIWYCGTENDKFCDMCCLTWLSLLSIFNTWFFLIIIRFRSPKNDIYFWIVMFQYWFYYCYYTHQVVFHIIRFVKRFLIINLIGNVFSVNHELLSLWSSFLLYNQISFTELWLFFVLCMFHTTNSKHYYSSSTFLAKIRFCYTNSDFV